MRKLFKKIKYLFAVAFLLSIILIANYSLVFADLNDITNLDSNAPSTSDIYNAFMETVEEIQDDFEVEFTAWFNDIRGQVSGDLGVRLT